jgi:hypothetical protein
MQKFPLFSTGILTKDFHQLGCSRGQTVTIVEFIEPNKYILEVLDNEGNVKNVIKVLESDIYINQSSTLSNTEREYHERVSEKGGKTIENFEEFMADFQKSREDRELERFDTELKIELEKVVKEKGYTEEDYHKMLNSKS